DPGAYPDPVNRGVRARRAAGQVQFSRADIERRRADKRPAGAVSAGPGPLEGRAAGLQQSRLRPGDPARHGSAVSWSRAGGTRALLDLWLGLGRSRWRLMLLSLSLPQPTRKAASKNSKKKRIIVVPLSWHRPPGLWPEEAGLEACSTAPPVSIGKRTKAR